MDPGISGSECDEVCISTKPPAFKFVLNRFIFIQTFLRDHLDRPSSLFDNMSPFREIENTRYKMLYMAVGIN